MNDPHCHSSSILVSVHAQTAFDIMSDGIKQGQWAWGSWQRQEVEPGLFVGNSIFDGKPTYVRLHADPSLLQVDYEVGRDPGAMQFRNMSRVIPGPLLGHGETSCVITLLTWRLKSQSDEAWLQMSTVHEAEMFLIRGLLERTPA